MKSELLRVIAVAAGLAGAAAAQDLIVYDNQLQNGFQDWSWATRDLADTTAPHSAPNAIRMEPDGWQGLYFHSDAGHDVADYLELRFWARGVGAGGQQLRVVLQSARRRGGAGRPRRAHHRRRDRGRRLARGGDLLRRDRPGRRLVQRADPPGQLRRQPGPGALRRPPLRRRPDPARTGQRGRRPRARPAAGLRAPVRRQLRDAPADRRHRLHGQPLGRQPDHALQLAARRRLERRRLVLHQLHGERAGAAAARRLGGGRVRPRRRARRAPRSC